MKRYIQSSVHDDISDENSGIQVLQEIARNATRPDELMRLADSPYFDVLREVVQNPHITEKVWERLSDKEHLLRYIADMRGGIVDILVETPYLSHDAYEMLAKSGNFNIRSTLAVGGNTPDDILRRLRSCDPAVSIRTTAKENLKLRSQYKEESAE